MKTNGLFLNGVFLKAGLALCLLFAAAACGQQEKAPDALSGNGEHQEAKALFKQNCVSCHGADLKGRVGKQSNLEAVGTRLSVEELADVIANGRDLMPAFSGKLSESEIQALAIWLSGLK